MPVTPSKIPGLISAYERLRDEAATLTEAARIIAPSAVADALCQLGGAASLSAGPLGPYLPPGTSNRGLSDLGYVLQQACDVPPPLPEPVRPPFTGGQCPGVPYRIMGEGSGTYQGESVTTGLQDGNVFIEGPLGAVTSRIGNVGQKEWYIPYGNGLEARITGGTPFAFWSDREYEIASVSRTDGLPDDCGDPPTPDEPPGGYPPIPDLPTSPVIPDGGPGGGGGYIFKPTVGPIVIGPDGSIQVPVVINVGGPSLSGEITIPVTVNLPDFSPTVNIGGSGGVTSPGQPSNPDDPPRPQAPICCDAPTEPGREIEPDPEEPAEGEDPPAGRRLVGLVVSATVDRQQSPATRIFQVGAGGDLWVPRIGSVYFSVGAAKVNDEPTIAETVDYSLKKERQYIPAPPDVVTVGWRVVPGKGVSVSVIPVYVLSNQPALSGAE